MMIDSDALRKRIQLRKEISKKCDINQNGQNDLDWVLRVIDEMEHKPTSSDWLKDSAEEIRTV